MKYLVTGGAGFIGSHLSEALLNRGDSVIALDDLSTGSSNNFDSIKKVPRFTFVNGNILDAQLVEQLIASVDGIFHFAAAVGVQKIMKDPVGSLRTNVEGSEIVMTTAARLKKPTLLASTSEIYGKNPEVPLTEDSDRVLGSPLVSRWIYSEAKAIDESIARSLFENEGWQVKIVRLFNTVGPRQSAAYGMVIPRFIEAARTGAPLQVHGDGTQRRVFCHIKDAIAGILALWDVKSGFGEAFNLGGFDETTINDLAQKIITKTNSSSTVSHIPYESMSGFEDIPRRVPDSSKLSKLTSWKATRSLDQILDDAIAQ